MMREGQVQIAVMVLVEANAIHLGTYALNLWRIFVDLGEMFQHRELKIEQSEMLIVVLIIKQQRLLLYLLLPCRSTPIQLLNFHLQPQPPRRREYRVKITFHPENARLVKSII